MKNINKVLDILEQTYPDAKCELDYTTPFELLVATILSAQCTDVRVNKVTSEMFKKYNTPKDFSKLSIDEISEEIKSCGLYKSKAEKIKLTSEKICNEYKPIKDNLIQMLNEVQEHYGYVPMNAQKVLSEFLNVPMAEIYGVVTFYSRFTLKPKGKYNIAVCLGTACFVKGSQKIMDRLKERLKIEPGETTKDGMFSIEETRCVGACGLAPVFTVNGEVYGKATVQKLDQVLDSLQNQKGGE